jgi:17 kDa outer membrane surface antigen
MRPDSKPRGRTPRTAALAGACLLLAAPASATVVQRSASDKPAALPVPETGGSPVVPSGPVHVACTQRGVTVVEGDQVKHLAVSPLTVIGALSFQTPGAHGRTLVIPFGDGRTTCVLSQEPDYLRRAAAAVRAAVAEDRAVTWAVARSGASGRVEPTRSFVGQDGRPCREFEQTVRVRGRTETSTGTACRQGGGDWRLMP